MQQMYHPLFLWALSTPLSLSEPFLSVCVHYVYVCVCVCALCV